MSYADRGLALLAPEDPRVLNMLQYELIRRMVLVDGLSQREVAEQLGHSRKTIAKALQSASPEPYTRAAPRPRPMLDGFVEIVRQWLIEDKSRHRKQRHSAVRIHERLVDEHGFTGSRRAVSDLVKNLRREMIPPEVFVPIEHPPGAEVQIDWGQAEIILNGELTKVMLFCARLAHSKATFARAYLREDQPSFLDAHVHLVDYLGGVPKIFAYDNLKSAVTKVTGRERALNRKFLELRSHYLFQSRFCNVARGNEKGHVENAVKRSQQNYLTPMPSVTRIDQLNEHLLARCAADLTRTDQSTRLTYGQLLQRERGCFQELPAEPFRPCIHRPSRVDRYATVQHDEVRYSVPIKHACEHAVVRIGIESVDVIVNDVIVATHRRGEPGQWMLSIQHYLPALERKPGLLDSGKPFKNSAFSESEQLLRRELEYRYGEDGTRQFINILLLSKQHDYQLVQQAVERCVGQRAFHEQAVRLELHHLTCSHGAEPAVALALQDREDLLQVDDGCRDLSIYDQLLIDKAANGSAVVSSPTADFHDSVSLSIPVQWSAPHDVQVNSENNGDRQGEQAKRPRHSDASLGERSQASSLANLLGGVCFTLCGMFS